VASVIEKLGQTAAGDLIEDQGQRAIGQGNGSVLTNQMLVVDPVKNGHRLGCLRLGLGHVRNRDDPQDEMPIVEGAHGRPRRPGPVRAQLAGDGETRHERLHGDGDPPVFSSKLLSRHGN